MTDTITIVVSPCAGRSPAAFSASWEGRYLCHSDTPFLDAARVLLAEGIPVETRIVMQHAATGTVSLRSTVGAAARLTISERRKGNGPRFAIWQPYPRADQENEPLG